MIKKTVAILLVAFCLLIPVSGYAASEAKSIGIQLDDKDLKMPAQSVSDFYLNSLYLPLRTVCEAMGYKVGWSSKDKLITVEKTGKVIKIDIKNYKISVDDHDYYLTDEYTTFGNSTYMSEGFFAEVFSLNLQWDKANNKIILTSIKENPVKLACIKETSGTDALQVTLQYPQISGLDNADVQKNLNSSFKQFAQDAKAEGMKYVDQNAADGYYPSTSHKDETYFDYRIKYNQNNILSVVFLDYQYTGGAHGSTIQSSHTYDLKTGNEYKMKDLFQDKVDYVSAINKSVKDTMQENNLTDVQLTPFETISTDQDFYISNNCVVVYFQEYEYFPYAAGIQEFATDYLQLKDILKPEFSFLAGN
ncbi:MAG: DUF4163 domain-containing protein [Bacillota bacterium]|nr:DUF4163 domain-containing protein [Bacillota bacterium]